MESRQLPVLSLDICSNNAESDFDLGLLSAGSTSSWYATSSYGPQTPGSGRSTPHFMTGFDLNSSFSSTTTDGFNFVELTPSSTKSGHLPMTPTTPMSEGMVDMCSSGLSGTPRGGEQHDGHGLPPSFTMGPFLDDTHATMSFHNDYSMTTNDFGIHPLVSGPSAPTPFGHISNPHLAQWTYPESPIRFDIDSPNRSTHTVQRLKREPGDNESLPSTPSRTSSVHDDPFTPTPPSTPDSVVSSKRLHMMNQARHRTTVLQRQVHQAAAAGSSCLGRRIKKEGIPGLIAEAEGTSTFTVERAAKFKCPLEGCSRMFRRKEHWKRHINTGHTDDGTECEFCYRRFNRFDNYTNHIRLHTRQPARPGDKEPRVKYFPEAVLLLEKLMQNRRKRRVVPEASSGKRPAAAAASSF